MSNFREKVNSHLPIILQLLSTTSLIVIALSALCGTQSLKKLAGAHAPSTETNHEMHKNHHSH